MNYASGWGKTNCDVRMRVYSSVYYKVYADGVWTPDY